LQRFPAPLDQALEGELGIPRVLRVLGEAAQLDNTLVFYILGENGTSAEGGQNGMFRQAGAAG